MGMEKDLPPGEKLVACFRPFLEKLVVSDLSPKTIQKHVDNLWALGGEIKPGRVRSRERKHRPVAYGVPQPNKGLQPTAYSLRCAPAFGSG